MIEASEIVVQNKHNLIEYYGVSRSRGSSVITVTNPRACPSGARFPAAKVQASPRAHRAPCTVVPRAVSQGLRTGA